MSRAQHTLSSTCGVLVHSFPASAACACTTRVDPRSPSWNTRTCVTPHRSWLHYKVPSYCPPDRGPIRIEYAKSKMAAEVGLICLCIRTNNLFTFYYEMEQKEKKMDNLNSYMPLST
ncbi:hypothetical protein NQ317_009065 [Molorchus minor]|uniref:Secreted protein n=1 Tax=Molorchus minor TaxID=1323400 RepID=A0ABQ9JE16_9CUCU|nr:hypothetical protein NQ317_009065 [Molorchus minor]